eukprot:332371_1
MNLLLMRRYHIRSMTMQAELFMTEAIGHNNGAFHPRIESGHIGKNLGEITLEQNFLDAPELDPHRYKLDPHRYELDPHRYKLDPHRYELDPDRLSHQELGLGDELDPHRYE